MTTSWQKWKKCPSCYLMVDSEKCEYYDPMNDPLYCPNCNEIVDIPLIEKSIREGRYFLDN